MVQVTDDRDLQDFWVVEKAWSPDVPRPLYVVDISWKSLDQGPLECVGAGEFGSEAQ
jgi:hypothetical protein